MHATKNNAPVQGEASTIPTSGARAKRALHRKLDNSDNKSLLESSRDTKLRYSTTSVQCGKKTVLLRSPNSKQTIELNIAENDSVPKEGIFHGENIFSTSHHVKNVLSIGPGKYAPTEFCIYLSMRPEKIQSIEIDKNSSEAAKELIYKNGLSDKIEILQGSLFEPVAGMKYDLIVSNIARMPRPFNATNSLRDYGGIDGWELLDKIISGAPDYLRPSGFLSLLSFDFQGIFNRTSDAIACLADRLYDNGFHITQVVPCKRKIRSGGVTHASLEHIVKLYPRAVFRDEADREIPKSNISTAVEQGLYFYDYAVTAKLR